MTTTPQAALLREAAQNALTTLDGIANANPRDKDDFDSPDEWIAWAKSRARWAADALREPVAREVYAERILKQMLHEASQSTQAEPAQAGELPEPDADFLTRCERTDELIEYVKAYARAALAARKPLSVDRIHQIGEALADGSYGPVGGPMECYQFEPDSLVEFVRAIESGGINGLEVKP